MFVCDVCACFYWLVLKLCVLSCLCACVRASNSCFVCVRVCRCLCVVCVRLCFCVCFCVLFDFRVCDSSIFMCVCVWLFGYLVVGSLLCLLVCLEFCLLSVRV